MSYLPIDSITLSIDAWASVDEVGALVELAGSVAAGATASADLFTDLHLFDPAAWQAQMRALQSRTTFHPDTLTPL